MASKKRITTPSRTDLAAMSVTEMRRRIRELEKQNAATASASAMLEAQLAERTRSLQVSEERFRGLFDSMQEGFFLAELISDGAGRAVDWRFLDVNPAHSKIIGLARADVVGRTVRELFPEVEDFWFEAQVKTALTGEAATLEGLFQTTGRYFQIQLYSPRRGQFACIFSDITERKRAEESLQTREAQLHSFVQQTPAAIAMFDRDMKYLAVSKRWMSDFGAGHRDLTGLNHYEIHPDLPNRWKEIHRKALAGEPQSSDEDLWLHADGGRLWLRWSVNPWRDARGDIGGIMILAEDISARKQTEEALRASETRYRQLIHGLPAAFFVCDAKGRITFYNAAAVALWGREPDLARDRWNGAHRLFTTDGKRIPLIRSPIALAVREDEPIRGAELIVERPDGSRSHVLVFPDPIHDSAGTVIGAMSMQVDVTEVHRTTAALLVNEARLRAILNTVVDAIITINPRGTITGVNPATERMFGYGSGEMIGQNVSMLMPAPYHAEHDGYLANYQRTGQARIIGIGREVQARRKDGSVFPIDLAVSEVKDMQLFTGVIRDITDRKRLEAEVLAIGEEERMRVAADLHDGICQEMAGLRFFANVLRVKLERAAHPLVAHASRSEKGIVGTMDHIRQVARGMNPVVSDGGGLQHALRLLAATTASRHRIRCPFVCSGETAVENPRVANELYRIAQEAIHNALRHGHAKRITVRLDGTDAEICLTVQDNGSGLPADVPNGAGMGLRLMKYRADLIGGSLTVQSRKRRGTEVICRIKRTSATP